MYVLPPETAKRIANVVRKDERESDFVDTKTYGKVNRRDLWLKVTNRVASAWNASQYVYTVDVFVTPFETVALHTGAKMINGFEFGSSDASLFIELDRFVKAIDFLNKTDEWYYVTSVELMGFPTGQYAWMDLTTVSQNQIGFDDDRAHARP